MITSYDTAEIVKRIDAFIGDSMTERAIYFGSTLTEAKVNTMKEVAEVLRHSDLTFTTATDLDDLADQYFELADAHRATIEEPLATAAADPHKRNAQIKVIGEAGGFRTVAQIIEEIQDELDAITATNIQEN